MRERGIGPARVGFALVLLVAAAVVAVMPVAVASLADYLYRRTLGDEVYRLTPAEAAPAPTHTRLHVEVVGLDELARRVTLRVTGDRVCADCDHQDRVVFVALRPDDARGAPREGLPPAAAVTLPAGSDRVAAELTLPVSGDLMAYPFDRYTLRLGLVLERLPAGAAGAPAPGAPAPVPAAEAAGSLFVSLEEHVPKVDIAAVRPVEAAEVRAEPAAPPGPGQPAYLAVTDLVLDRPLYLRAQVVLVVALVAAGAGYAAALRPVAEQLSNAGGLLLGVWGVRALLLGALPPHTTAVDAVLTLVIFVLLAAVTVRVLYHLHDRAGLRVLPGPRRAAPPAGAPAPPGTAAGPPASLPRDGARPRPPPAGS
jgi:hypothetical protein